jgi:hypothetical protein
MKRTELRPKDVPKEDDPRMCKEEQPCEKTYRALEPET